MKMAADFGSFHIREFSASYYVDETRTWVYGKLSVTVERVLFCGKHSGDQEVLVKFNYRDVSEVKKTTTGLIFSAVTILTKDGSKHWFSSLPCRESVHNVITYFLRENLFLQSKQEPKSNPSPEHRTEMGRKLLTELEDSHKTLSSAADQLMSQGHQIDSSVTHMDELNIDLDVGDKLLTGIESWFGKWKMPKVYKKIDPIVVTNDDIPEITEYEVLYTKMEANKMNTQLFGILRIAVEGLFILTAKQKLVHHFKWSDISRVRILSPCEIIVTRFLIGQPDLSYDVVCSSLTGFLQLLDRRLKSKVEYVTDGFVKSATYKPENSPIKQTRQLMKDKETLLKTDSVRNFPHGTLNIHTQLQDEHTSTSVSGSDGAMSEIQTQKPKEVVSDSEVKEIQRNLEDLRSLAIAVQEETDVQNEKLGKLTMSVDATNVRISENNARVKKLIG